MTRRVEGKAAIVVGGGQTPGETIGNGRATAILLAKEGARVVVADRRLESAEETVDMIRRAGGEAWAADADVTNEESTKLFLHSDEAGFITGVALAVDGGEGVCWGS